MPQSLAQIFIHTIFHVKNDDILILPEHDDELYRYLGGLVKDTQSIPIEINGIENHVHILCLLSKNISLAKFLEYVKSNSSRWIKTFGPHYRDFRWQGGYAGYSVSKSKVETVRRYIQNQKEHHKKQSFEDEYIQFLDECGVDYNPDFLWT